MKMVRRKKYGLTKEGAALPSRHLRMAKTPDT